MNGGSVISGCAPSTASASEALMFSPDKAASQRAFGAMMQMVKIDLPAMQRAYDGS